MSGAARRARRNVAKRIARDLPSEEMREAVHEAGHAVANVVLGRPFLRVSLERRTHPGGMLLTDGVIFDEATLADRRRRREAGEIDDADLTADMAGPMAERALLGGRTDDEWRIGADLDFERLRATIRNAGRSGAEGEIGARLMNRANEVIAQSWAAIGRVSKALLEKGTLTFAEVNELVREGG